MPETETKVQKVSDEKLRRATQLADQRYGMALWYAFGVADVRPDLKEKMNRTPKAEFQFAELHKDEAFNYHMGRVTFLPSVQDAFKDWIKSLD